MVIQQGDIFWVELGESRGSESAYRHPYAVIQNDVFNSSQISTTVVVALTSNLSRANIPGNVRLKKGEGNLPKSSVVNVTQILTLNKFDLIDKIGTLSKKRVQEILSGIKLVIEPRYL